MRGSYEFYYESKYHEIPEGFKLKKYTRKINNDEDYKNCNLKIEQCCNIEYEKSITYFIKENCANVYGFRIIMYNDNYLIFKQFLADLFCDNMTLVLYHDDDPLIDLGSSFLPFYQTYYRIVIDKLIKSLLENQKIRSIKIEGDFDDHYINKEEICKIEYNKTLLEFKCNNKCIFSRKPLKILNILNDVYFLFEKN
jgi:hypothetical protein